MSNLSKSAKHVPAAGVIIVDKKNRVLLQLRTDNNKRNK